MTFVVLCCTLDSKLQKKCWETYEYRLKEEGRNEWKLLSYNLWKFLQQLEYQTVTKQIFFFCSLAGCSQLTVGVHRAERLACCRFLSSTG